MLHRKFLSIGAILLLALALGAAALVAPQAYMLDWWTADGGGGTSSGGAYSLNGTMGQPDAGVMSGAVYTLTSGFWSAVSTGLIPVYLPIIRR